MNQNELFILHPIAYAHAQEILRLESDMIRNGHPDEQRLTFLEAELERVLSQSDVVMTELLASMMPSNQQELVLNIDAVRSLLQRHGFSGTLRRTRNLQRRHGLNLPVLDPLILVGALGVLASDPEVQSTLEILIAPRISSIVNHPSVEAADRQLASTQHHPELPSVREQRLIARAQELIVPIMDELATILDFNDGEVRLIALLYGRILDVPFVDILTTLAGNGSADHVRSNMQESLASSCALYRHVLHTIVSKRIHRLQKGGQAAPAPSEPVAPKPEPQRTIAPPNPESDDNILLTITEAMALLNVSRQTINTLMREGKLARIKIGRSVRLSRTDLERFIGRETCQKRQL